MNMIEYQIKRLKTAKHIISQAQLSPLDRIKIDKVIDEAISTIQDLSAKLAAANMERGSAHYNGGWIPVEEKLPNEPFGCLVTIIDTEPMTMENFENILSYHVGYDGTQWNDADELPIPYEVIAWMPLPAPYRKEV